MTPLFLLAAAATMAAVASPQPEQVFSVYDFGARGDGKHNDTSAIQLALNAAAAAGGGVAHLPHNGTYLTGGGLNALGHVYDGVTLRVDGAVTVPGPTAKPAWSTPEQCGTAEHVKGSGGEPTACPIPFQPLRCTHRAANFAWLVGNARNSTLAVFGASGDERRQVYAPRLRQLHRLPI